jgi:hypothetical protein
METKSIPASAAPATRREFLKKTAVATAAVAATPLFKTKVYGQAPSANVIGANDRITVGSSGVGAQGMNAHVNLLSAHVTNNNIALAAVCDVWPKRTAAAKAFIERASPMPRWRPSVITKLLERKTLMPSSSPRDDPMRARDHRRVGGGASMSTARNP